MRHFISMSIFAGLLIGIAGLVYLRVGGLAGAILFAFGLLSVVMCGAQLFTGKSGYLPYRDIPRLVLMLVGNGIGCLIAGVITTYCANTAVTENLDAILLARDAASWHALLVTSIGTGLIMTLAVYGVRRDNWLPLLFGVPVFIMCGLPHCVADAYYYGTALLLGEGEWMMLWSWLWAIVGNYIGCNLPRWFMGKAFEA